jgi:hypothetical protein
VIGALAASAAGLRLLHGARLASSLLALLLAHAPPDGVDVHGPYRSAFATAAPPPLPRDLLPHRDLPARLMRDDEDADALTSRWTAPALWASHVLKLLAAVVDRVHALADPALPRSPIQWLLDQAAPGPDAVTAAGLLAGYLTLPAVAAPAGELVAALSQSLPARLWLWAPHAVPRLADAAQAPAQPELAAVSLDAFAAAFAVPAPADGPEEARGPEPEPASLEDVCAHARAVYAAHPAACSPLFTLLRLRHSYDDALRAALTHTIAHALMLSEQDAAAAAQADAAAFAPLPPAVALGHDGPCVSSAVVLWHVAAYTLCSFAAPQVRTLSRLLSLY